MDDLFSGLIKTEPFKKPEISLEESLNIFRANLAIYIEYQRLNASIIRAKYMALRDEGFNSQQALELCKGMA